MKKVLVSFLACAALCLLSPTLKASGETSSGALTVTATVDPSISLTFHSYASGVPLSAEDSAAATLAFGHVRAFGHTPATGATQAGLAGAARARPSPPPPRSLPPPSPPTPPTP